MNDFLSIPCPHCGEEFDIPLDLNEGNSEFIVDCEICCRPISITVKLRAGEVENVQVSPA